MSRRLNFSTASQRTGRQTAQMPSRQKLPTMELLPHTTGPRVAESRDKKMPRAFSVRRAPWTRFYYCKGARGRWNRVERVLQGMRWNAYLCSGTTRPHFKPADAPRAPAIVSGALTALRTTNATELVLQEIKVEHLLVAKERRDSRAVEQRESKEERLAQVIELSSHPLLNPAAHREEPEHQQERHCIGLLYYPVHHSTAESRTEERQAEVPRTETVPDHGRQPVAIHTNHSETHHEQPAVRTAEGKHDLETINAPIVVAVISATPEHNAVIYAFTHTDEHHAPHHHVDNVQVTYHNWHPQTHSAAEIIVHHGHQHGQQHHHHANHGHGKTEHDTYYYAFQQPWTALLIGMPGSFRNSRGRKPKVSKLPPPAELKIPAAVNTYALNVQFPRRRFRKPKIATADAYPP